MTPAELKQLGQRILDDVAAATRDGDGITRESFGAGEERALQVLEKYAAELGLHAERDRYQNLWLRLPQDARPVPPVVIGSHVDSVPLGGNFDGLAGVVAGILVLLRMRHDWQSAPPVQVLALRGEESAWYGRAYAGSLALLGKLPRSALALTHRSGHGTLGQAMADSGIDVDAIARGEALVGAGDIAAWLELHIEQGPVMVAREWPTAVVTGIRGNIRHNRIRCIGEAGHSGAVPRWLRRDAMLAVAQLLARMDEHWRVLLQMGMDLVMTSGICSTLPDSHAVSVIPGEVQFSFEVRSQDRDTLERFYALMQQECNALAAERGVRFELDEQLTSSPATMDSAWIARLSQATIAAGMPAETIPSGAGHDAAVFANAGIPAAMVFIRNANGSHNVHERMDMNDFMSGIDVLTGAIQAMATTPAVAVAA